MFYTIRQFSFPFLLAIALHAAAVLALYRGWQPDTTLERVIKPNIVRSELVVLKPKSKRPKPTAQPPAATSQPKPVKPKPETKPLVDPAVAEAEKKRLAEIREKERENKEREEKLRQERLAALVSDAFNQTLEEELSTLEDTDDTEAASSYRQGIYERIVRNWSRPPSARNGMEAHVLVELIPTGDVVAVTILKSSGSGAFDQSVEAAVRKSRNFDVPDDNELFEDYFRRFSVLFRPEDLLR